MVTQQVGFEQALKFAFNKEEQAAMLYSRMANMALDVQAKSFFVDMSKEEEKHKAMLEELREKGANESIEFSRPLDMQIVEYLQPGEGGRRILPAYERSGDRRYGPAAFYHSGRMGAYAQSLRRIRIRKALHAGELIIPQALAALFLQPQYTHARVTSDLL